MIYLLPDYTDVTNNQFRWNDFSYPSNWARLATEEELQMVGIITLTEVYPQLQEGESYSDQYVDDMDNMTRTYTANQPD